MSVLTDGDRRRLEERGISPAEAERQLELLRQPPPPPELDRPATAGDGLVRIPPERHEALIARFARARSAGRAMKLVPASGAASRMFRSLLPWIDYAGKPGAFSQEVSRRAIAGDPDVGDPVRFLSELARFPFYPELAAAFAAQGQDVEALRNQGDAGAVLHTLLAPERMDYDARPKGLIPFHRYPEGPRTAVAEHLASAAHLVADGERRVRVHFTVPADGRERFESHAAAECAGLSERLGVCFETSFSVQSTATDTLALALGEDGDGGPFRTDEGEILLRPGGHGALLGNLHAIAVHPDGPGADLVFVQNVDNVQAERLQEEAVRSKEILGGYLVELEERVGGYLARLGERPELAELEAMEAFLAERLGVEVPAAWKRLPPPERACHLAGRLDRPLRVAGMVINRGEAGGGPFWVRGTDGVVTAQIVEGAQVDADSPEQAAIVRAATHFNPVDLVCALRDRKGEPYDLARFVDPRAVFTAEKSHQGRPLLALERPGLWNGAMAGWNTAFVEVPEMTFSPVKTVFDLLRKEHQG